MMGEVGFAAMGIDWPQHVRVDITSGPSDSTRG